MVILSSSPGTPMACHWGTGVNKKEGKIPIFYIFSSKKDLESLIKFFSNDQIIPL